MLRFFCAVSSVPQRSTTSPQTLRARVNGAGPTGTLSALALADAGWQVELCDPLTAAALRERNRAYALTHSSQSLLQRLGLWDALLPALAPFRRLELCDRATHLQVPFTAADLPWLGGDQPVGWILQHQDLMGVLLEAVQHQTSINSRLGLTPVPSPLGVDLVVAADGHRSPTRQAAGISQWALPYRQGCLTVQVRLRGSAPDQAWELFRPEGPFAVLPLGGDAFQLVWSAPLSRLRQLEQLDAVAFLDALSGALPEELQAEVLLDQPRAFPVALELAWPLARRGTVAIGEVAHRCHPVGGQGLNLCWRDVDQLHRLARRCATGRLRPSALPGAYGRSRVLDIALVLLATDALVRLFSNRFAPLLPVRRLALLALGRFGWMRQLSLRAMSEGPCRLWRT